MDVQAVSTAIADVLADLDISVFDYVPDTPGTTPCAYIYPEPFTYDATFREASGAPHDDVNFVVRLLVSSQVVQGGQQALNALISDDVGAASVPTVIRKNSTLNGVVDAAHLTDMRNYGVVTLGDSMRFFSAELVINILT